MVVKAIPRLSQSKEHFLSPRAMSFTYELMKIFLTSFCLLPLYIHFTAPERVESYCYATNLTKLFLLIQFKSHEKLLLNSLLKILKDMLKILNP